MLCTLHYVEWALGCCCVLIIPFRPNEKKTRRMQSATKSTGKIRRETNGKKLGKEKCAKRLHNTRRHLWKCKNPVVSVWLTRRRSTRIVCVSVVWCKSNVLNCWWSFFCASCNSSSPHSDVHLRFESIQSTVDVDDDFKWPFWFFVSFEGDTGTLTYTHIVLFTRSLVCISICDCGIWGAAHIHLLFIAQPTKLVFALFLCLLTSNDIVAAGKIKIREKRITL